MFGNEVAPHLQMLSGSYPNGSTFFQSPQPSGVNSVGFQNPFGLPPVGGNDAGIFGLVSISNTTPSSPRGALSPSNPWGALTPEQIAEIQGSRNNNLFLESAQSNFIAMWNDPTRANSIINLHTPYLGTQTFHNDVVQGIDGNQQRATLSTISSGLGTLLGLSEIGNSNYLGGGHFLPNGSF